MWMFGFYKTLGLVLFHWIWSWGLALKTSLKDKVILKLEPKKKDHLLALGRREKKENLKPSKLNES